MVPGGQKKLVAFEREHLPFEALLCRFSSI